MGIWPDECSLRFIQRKDPTFKYPRLINPLPSFPDSVVDPSVAADKNLHQARENLPLLRHQPLFRTALRVRDNMKPIAKTSDTCLFKRWLCILADNWEGSEAGRWIKQLRPAQSEECLRTILGGKARSTFDKRARRAASMVAYARSRRCQLFPLSDVVVIPYLTSLKFEGKRSAILDSVETVQFLRHVLDRC